MTRITRGKLYTQVAKLFAERSTCGRLQVGCVITRDGRIIATGYNGPPKKYEPANFYPFETQDGSCSCDTDLPCTKSIHAEANAIAYSARNGIALEGTTIYCTHSPCLKCSELIIQAGIKEVVFIEYFRDAEGIQLLKANNINVNLYEEQKH